MKKTLSTLALSLFALVGVAQAADITLKIPPESRLCHKIHSESLCLILVQQTHFVH